MLPEVVLDTAEWDVCESALKFRSFREGGPGQGQGQNRIRENRPSGIAGGPRETWSMDKAKRARTAETPKLPSLGLPMRAPEIYPDRTAPGQKRQHRQERTSLRHWKRQSPPPPSRPTRNPQRSRQGIGRKRVRVRSTRSGRSWPSRARSGLHLLCSRFPTT